MASIKFRLRSKLNKNVPIKVRIVLGRDKQDLELNTGFTINPKDWNTADKENPKKGDDFPKQNTPENKVIFTNLKKLESFLFLLRPDMKTNNACEAIASINSKSSRA